MKRDAACTQSTGATFNGEALYLATIGKDREGRTRLIKSKSDEIRLLGREQPALHMFARELLTFLQSAAISQLVLVISPGAGTHMAKAECYKAEAVVQLMPVKVILWHAAAIPPFACRTDICIPGPDRSRLGRQEAKAQERAILAAVYGFHHEVKNKRGVSDHDLVNWF